MLKNIDTRLMINTQADYHCPLSAMPNDIDLPVEKAEEAAILIRLDLEMAKDRAAKIERTGSDREFKVAVTEAQLRAQVLLESEKILAVALLKAGLLLEGRSLLEVTP